MRRIEGKVRDVMSLVFGKVYVDRREAVRLNENAGGEKLRIWQ